MTRKCCACAEGVPERMHTWSCHKRRGPVTNLILSARGDDAAAPLSPSLSLRLARFALHRSSCFPWRLPWAEVRVFPYVPQALATFLTTCDLVGVRVPRSWVPRWEAMDEAIHLPGLSPDTIRL